MEPLVTRNIHAEIRTAWRRDPDLLSASRRGQALLPSRAIDQIDPERPALNAATPRRDLLRRPSAGKPQAPADMYASERALGDEALPPHVAGIIPQRHPVENVTSLEHRLQGRHDVVLATSLLVFVPVISRGHRRRLLDDRERIDPSCVK